VAHRHFGLKAFRREDLSSSGWFPLLPVVTGYGVSQPGRIRDKNWAGDQCFGGWILLVLSAATVGAVVPGSDPSDGRAAGKTSEAKRKQLHDETMAAADRIAAEAHAKLPRSMATAIGAIYVRFSTLFQDSAPDQIRELFQFAVENKIFVPREYVFFDLGVRGYKNQREGLDQLRAVLGAKKVQVLLLFATNRLFRKVYLTLQFVEQTAVEKDIRCVFVKSGVDTADKDRWRTNLHMRAMMDEFQVGVNAEHIRSALEGMFLEGLVRGTLPPGYKGEPIPGKLTKRKRPRCRIVIDPEEEKIIVLIFEWFVRDRLSRSEIAQKLNAIPDVPLPRKSKRWNRNSVTAVLKRTEYRGLWKFSVIEKTFLPSKDYARQTPREKPLNEATFEKLRIISDALWFGAQARLPKDNCIPGRKAKNEESDPARRVLSGLLWCPEHDRPMRAWSAYGKYLGCPHCATLEPQSRPLFSKPPRTVVLRLLCERLEALIRQDGNLVDNIIAACQEHAAAIQRPDPSVIATLEKSASDLARKIEFNMRNAGETEEDEKEIAAVLRSLRQERKSIQDQLGLLKAMASKPVRVPDRAEVQSMLDNFAAILQRAAGSQLDDRAIVRDVLQTLTGGRIDMHQQGQRKNMRGWLQGRFTIRLLDVLVQKASGTHLTTAREGTDVVIDFRRPRKSDADKAIALWLDGAQNIEIAKQLGTVPSYISRLLPLGASRMGTTLESLRPQRKLRPVDPARAPGYQQIANEVKTLWWDELFPLGTVAKRLEVSTVTADAAKAWWYESRGLKTPSYEEWCLEVERRVLELFDAEELTVGEIGEKVHRAHGTVMQIVKAACKRLGRPLPDAWARRSRIRSKEGDSPKSAA